MAFVAGSALARLQVQRLAGDRKEVAVFEKAEAAVDWLVAGGAECDELLELLADA